MNKNDGFVLLIVLLAFVLGFTVMAMFWRLSYETHDRDYGDIACADENNYSIVFIDSENCGRECCIPCTATPTDTPVPPTCCTICATPDVHATPTPTRDSICTITQIPTATDWYAPTATATAVPATATNKPGCSITPGTTVDAIETPIPNTVEPTEVGEPTEKPKCNRGVGNGSENCDPGNSSGQGDGKGRRAGEDRDEP